jgi:hypothetical protein
VQRLSDGLRDGGRLRFGQKVLRQRARLHNGLPHGSPLERLLHGHQQTNGHATPTAHTHTHAPTSSHTQQKSATVPSQPHAQHMNRCNEPVGDVAEQCPVRRLSGSSGITISGCGGSSGSGVGRRDERVHGGRVLHNAEEGLRSACSGL